MAAGDYTAITWNENDVFTATQATNISGQLASISAVGGVTQDYLSKQYRAGRVTRSAVAGNNSSGASLSITFSSAMPNTNYAVTGSISSNSAWCKYLHWAIGEKTTSGCTLYFWNTNSSDSPALFFDYQVIGY